MDLACGHRTYDKHDGTDIALLDRAAISKNVPVFAAAAGLVVRARDGDEDHFGTQADIAAAKAVHREAGNVVSLIHQGDWITEYAHMKKGSIAVHQGQIVKKGDRLGYVGETGMAEFAHLHFTVKHKNTVVDPFAGEAFTHCGDQLSSLWEMPIHYEPFVISAAGFATSEPHIEDIAKDASSPSTIPQNADQLGFWTVLYGAEPGDHIEVEIRDPDGKIFLQKEVELTATYARFFSFAAKRLQGTPLSPGAYKAKTVVTRKSADREIAKQEIERVLTVVPR